MENNSPTMPTTENLPASSPVLVGANRHLSGEKAGHPHQKFPYQMILDEILDNSNFLLNQTPFFL
jgi:hypothetical protein